MTYQEIQKIGTKVDEQDTYNNGIYSFTSEFWMTTDGLYVREYHPNTNRYSGQTNTYKAADIEDFKKRNEYYFEVEVGMSEEGYQKALDYIKNLK